MSIDRRDFGKIAAAGTMGLVTSKLSAATEPEDTELKVHLFSKPLQFLGIEEASEFAAELGFDGLELTIRPGGHVEPNQVEKQLPRAVEVMSAHGLESKLFVSKITSVDDDINLQSLKTAAESGFQYYRMGYYKPDAKLGLTENLDRARTSFHKLMAFNEETGLYGAYQNHAGQMIGSYVTDIAYLLEGVDPQWGGCQFDILHATVEGGSAWPLGLRYLKNHISTIAIKDFLWTQVGTKWRVEDVPFGEGMVDFDRYFRLLREYNLSPTVSMHYEYNLGGAERGKREVSMPKKEIFTAMKRDLDRLHQTWKQSAS